MTDELCIFKFIENSDEAAFNCLVNRYRNSIRRIVYTVIKGPKEDIEDTEQEILWALYRSLPEFKYKSDFRTYLFRMCRNKSIDFIRKNSRIRKLDKLALTDHQLSDYTTPETILEEKTKRELISAALFDLKESDRSLIIMKDVENLSIDEIARVFKRPSGTIKSRLHRARVRAAEIIIKKGIK